MKKFLVFAPACLALLFSACTSPSSSVTRYMLAPCLPKSEQTAESVPAIQFARISIPAYVDTSQIVTRSGANTVLVNENRRWAEPLARAVQRLIPTQVAQLVRGKQLKSFENVSVFIDRLDGPLHDGPVQISAQVIISSISDSTLRNESFLFTKSVPVPTRKVADESACYADYAQALSSAIFELSLAISEALEAPSPAK